MGIFHSALKGLVEQNYHAVKTWSLNFYGSVVGSVRTDGETELQLL